MPHPMDRETIHMALATFYHVNPDIQVIRMAKRYQRKARSPAVKRIYKQLINDYCPSEAVLEVYEERYGEIQ
jgi:hypothetical protein